MLKLDFEIYKKKEKGDKIALFPGKTFAFSDPSPGSQIQLQTRSTCFYLLSNIPLLKEWSQVKENADIFWWLFGFPLSFLAQIRYITGDRVEFFLLLQNYQGSELENHKKKKKPQTQTNKQKNKEKTAHHKLLVTAKNWHRGCFRLFILSWRHPLILTTSFLTLQDCEEAGGESSGSQTRPCRVLAKQSFRLTHYSVHERKESASILPQENTSEVPRK